MHLPGITPGTTVADVITRIASTRTTALDHTLLIAGTRTQLETARLAVIDAIETNHQIAAALRTAADACGHQGHAIKHAADAAYGLYTHYAQPLGFTQLARNINALRADLRHANHGRTGIGYGARRRLRVAAGIITGAACDLETIDHRLASVSDDLAGEAARTTAGLEHLDDAYTRATAMAR